LLLFILLNNPEMSGKDADNGRGPPPTGLPERKELSPTLQKLVDKTDKEENFYDELYDGR
jgi:mitochondrial fission process protein 1